MSRITVAQFDYTTKPNTIKLLRTDNGYKQTTSLEDKQAMHKQAWYIMHSPKLLALTIKTFFYSKDIASMVSYAEMINIPVEVITPSGKFHSSREFLAWFQETQQAEEEHMLSVENINLLVKHAPELLRYAKRSSDELIRVLREQIRLSGYDVDMQSMFITDGLNSGVVEDGKGRHEWSRSHTKHYERYDRTLKDLILMYISCKFYKQAGFEAETDGIGRHDIDSYTERPLTEVMPFEVLCILSDIIDDKKKDPHLYAGIDYMLPKELEDVNEHIVEAACLAWNASIEDPVIKDKEDVVVPRSACGLGLQNYMN